MTPEQKAKFWEDLASWRNQTNPSTPSGIASLSPKGLPFYPYEEPGRDPNAPEEELPGGGGRDFSAMTPAQRKVAFEEAVKRERAAAGLLTESGFLPGGGSPFNYSSDHVRFVPGYYTEGIYKGLRNPEADTYVPSLPPTSAIAGQAATTAGNFIFPGAGSVIAGIIQHGAGKTIAGTAPFIEHDLYKTGAYPKGAGIIDPATNVVWNEYPMPPTTAENLQERFVDTDLAPDGSRVTPAQNTSGLGSYLADYYQNKNVAPRPAELATAPDPFAPGPESEEYGRYEEQDPFAPGPESVESGRYNTGGMVNPRPMMGGIGGRGEVLRRMFGRAT